MNVDKQKKTCKLHKVFTWVLVLVMALTMLPIGGYMPVKANNESHSRLTNAVSTFTESHSYKDYLNSYSALVKPVQTISFKGVDYAEADLESKARVEKEFQGESDVLLWEGLGGKVSWIFTVSQEGLYQLRLNYFALLAESRNIELKILIDHQFPFDSSKRIILPRLFTNATEITQDSRGNDIRPQQIPFNSWLRESVTDKEGLYSEPFSFYLSEGTHVLTLEGVRAGFALKTIEFYNDEPIPNYSEYRRNVEPSKSLGVYVVEGESAQYKSDSMLYPMYDRSGPDTSPYDPVKLKLNTIGQGSYNAQGQFIMWEIMVPEEGFYKISIRYRQNLVRGRTSYRKLYINEKIPFVEAKELPFEFHEKWQQKILGPDGGYWFFLQKGKNTLRLEVTPGPSGEVSANTYDTIAYLNMIYRKIIMITGTTPDSLRDYQLIKEIPYLIQDLNEALTQCNNLKSKVQEYNNGKKTDDSSTIVNAIILLQSYINNPETIANRISRLKDSISSLSTMIMGLKNQPLEIDYITISADDDKLVEKPADFIKRMTYGFRAFFGSFYEDYTSIGSISHQKEAINVWINLGRDQTQILKSLVDSSFTPKTGVPVNISLVQQSLVQATLSGQGPDVVLFAGQSDPVNLASRNALVDLSQFDTFTTVTERFNSWAIVPYKYNDGVFGLPIQESFPMLFYRIDIFQELGLTPPKTWDEFYQVIQALQKNNMTAGIPNMPPESQMTTNYGIFASLIKQLGGEFYNSKLTSTMLDSKVAIDAFKQWTGFYASYGLPYQYDFYNRFRTGEMPLALDNYTLYNKLEVAAPEIKGLWDMLPIPGMEKDNGEIDYSVYASGTCGIIMKGTENPEASWAFLDWFTSDDIQLSYGLELEGLLGASGRYDTANISAFKKLPWSAEQQQSILKQWETIFELPQVPGNYYVERNITNAFRQVVFKNRNPREVLIDYNREINKEIQRKHNELNLYD